MIARRHPKALVCKCCKLPQLALNERGLCEDCSVCLHCEKNPSINPLGLCQRCNAMTGVRHLYKRSPTWTPEWEQHLRCLTHIHQEELKRIYGGVPHEECESTAEGELHRGED